MVSLRMVLLLATLGSARAEFNAHWDDWKAELDGYRLVQPRYGQPRDGWAVMVWVTEPFSASRHVKLDRPDAGETDRVDVMKLNLLRRFQTGIYDYSLMLSVFSPLVFDEKAISAIAHRPLKVTFSCQDWCGQTFHQLDSRGSALKSDWRSYFEAEGDGRDTLTLTEDTVLEDELWFRLRGVTHTLAPGTYRFVPSLVSARLAHSPLSVGTLEVRRGDDVESVTVPAGTFDTVRYDLIFVPGDGRPEFARTIWIEKSYPHRIIAWSGDVLGPRGNEPSQERGELTGSIRDTYWQHNRPEDGALRRALHLPE